LKTVPLTGGSCHVSEIALGTWPFAGDEIWGPSDESECIRVVHAAIDHGINLFDTAPNYGNGRSETVLGTALRGRSDVLVAGKFKIDGESAAGLRTLLTGSLQRLGRDHMDLMQIHWPASTTAETLNAMEALARFREEGLVRFVGVCNFGRYDLDESRAYPLVTNQLPYNLLWRVIEDEIVPATTARGLTTIAYSPFQQGLLTGRYRSVGEFPSGRQRTRHFETDAIAVKGRPSDMRSETGAALNELIALSDRLTRPLRELALAFVRSRPFVDVVLVGARDVAQLDQICNPDQSALSDDEVKLFERATERLREAAGGNPDMYRNPGRVRHAKPGGQG